MTNKRARNKRATIERAAYGSPSRSSTMGIQGDYAEAQQDKNKFIVLDHEEVERFLSDYKASVSAETEMTAGDIALRLLRSTTQVHDEMSENLGGGETHG